MHLRLCSSCSLEEGNLSTRAEDPKVTQPIVNRECKSFQLLDLSTFPVPTNFFPVPLLTPSFALGFTCLNFFVSPHLHLFTLLMYIEFCTHLLHHLPVVIHTHLFCLTTEHFLNFSLHTDCISFYIPTFHLLLE